MPDFRFYAAAQDPDDNGKINGYVPSKFLQRNGIYVMDPVPGASQRTYLYSDANGSNKTQGTIANPNNYIVVPENYNEADAKSFAAGLADTLKRKGLRPVLEQITSAFWPGGSEELQRNPRWGIPPNSFVPAYISAASDHFGYVTGAAGLPRELADYGGGLHNLYSWMRGKASDALSGMDRDRAFLSPVNAANIAQGYAAALAAGRHSEPFNDYGYAPPQATRGEIGSGNGIAEFPAILAGIDPDEQAPPSWPPQPNASIRYLATRPRW